MFTTKTITTLISATTLLFIAQTAIADNYICSASIGCNVIVRPGSGWHMKLVDIEKNHKYLCYIKGIAAIGNLNNVEANKIGITDAQITRGDWNRKDLTFTTMTLNIENGYLLFDMENPSDIPMNESITCSQDNT